MNDPIRKLMLLGLVLPLALLLGYVAANPLNVTSLMVIGGVMCLLLFPIVLKWHHSLAILSINLYVNAFFLPGQPDLWVVLAAVSVAITYVGWLTDRRGVINWDGQVALPLIILAIVIVGTAYVTGGVGGRALGGSQWGAKKYLYVIASIIAFFAISLKPIATNNAQRIVKWFFLLGISAVISNLLYLAGPQFYFLFNLFPAELASLQADAIIGSTLTRYSGVSTAAQFALLAMIATYGLRGIFSMRHGWRVGLFASLLIVGLFGGYRTLLVKLFVLCAFQFYFEKMFKPRYMIPMVVAGVVSYVGIMAVATKLPLSFQRVFTVLPFVEVDAAAALDARGTLDWRFEMWKVVVPEVPRYLFRGKGYSFDGTDYTLTEMAASRFGFSAYESTLISGNYHNGPLTLIIPFGIWGVIPFVWFLVVSGKRLWKYYREGPPELRLLNTFFLAWFCQASLHFFVFYGQFEMDLIKFTSLMGLSIAINRGATLRRKTVENESVIAETRDLKLADA